MVSTRLKKWALAFMMEFILEIAYLLMSLIIITGMIATFWTPVFNRGER